MPTVELRGLAALEAWGRKIASGYGVPVRDLSSSWRDGLAFCAIIHHFRPDLINFESLSKENVLYNNQLAFSVGAKLGIPALLDAEDMLLATEPDRSSIALYLSEVYACFVGSKKPQQLGRTKSAIFNRTYTNNNNNNNNEPQSTTNSTNSNAATPPTVMQRSNSTYARSSYSSGGGGGSTGSSVSLSTPPIPNTTTPTSNNVNNQVRRFNNNFTPVKF